MTCIAGLVDSGRVYLGGDSAGTDANFAIACRQEPKVFRVGELAIGFCQSFRMGQILHFVMDPPPFTGHDPERWMVRKFIPAAQRAFKAGGYGKEKSGERTGGTFLVGVRGRLFVVESDYQVGERTDRFDAIGCGADAALGALYATPGGDPGERLRIALEAAEATSAAVRRPFRYVATDPWSD